MHRDNFGKTVFDYATLTNVLFENWIDEFVPMHKPQNKAVLRKELYADIYVFVAPQYLSQYAFLCIPLPDTIAYRYNFR